MFGLASKILVPIVSIAAGMGYFSFWWGLIPVFLAGAFSLSNGPHYDAIIAANQAGHLSLFPKLLVIALLPWLVIGAILFWIASVLS
jgi:hypothetical protein